MKKLIQDYLEETASKYPEKVAFVCGDNSITYSDLRRKAIEIANEILNRNIDKSPIAIVLDKNIDCIAAFFGVAYSGNFYTLIDVDMPKARIDKIREVLSPVLYITDSQHKYSCYIICWNGD